MFMDKKYLQKLINENLQYINSKNEVDLTKDSFKEYLNANNSLHDVLIQDCLKDDELKRMSVSEIYWSNDKKSNMPILKSKKR